jgi:hypothetical protein
MICIRLCAKNDRNGNPRRVYILLDSEGEIVRAVNEGYLGSGALDGILDPSVNRSLIRDFSTTPAEYRRLLREYGRGNVPHND